MLNDGAITILRCSVEHGGFGVAKAHLRRYKGFTNKGDLKKN